MKTTSRIKLRLAVATLVAGLMTVGASSAGAATIYLTSDLTNPSFENSPPASDSIPGWTANTYSNGFAQERGPDNYFIHATLGSYVLELSPDHGSTSLFDVTQSIPLATFSPVVGQTITLNVDALQETGATGPADVLGTIALTLNGTPIAFNTTNGTSVQTADPVNGPYYSFNNVTASFVVGQGQAGDTLGIELLRPNSSTTYAFDDVRLEVVPEPSTWAMMFAGLISLVGLRCLRRQA